MVAESKRTSFSVRDALALAPLRRGEPEILAGVDALGTEIRWTHAGEGLNLASLLKGGELLITTGIDIGTSGEVQRRFVADLAARRIAALAIELGSALTTVPEALVEAANEHGLCLIAFHREVRFVEISESVHRAIIDRDGELIRRGEQSRSRLISLMLRGAHISDVLVELSGFIRNPVVLERAGQGIAYHACFEADDATVLGAWGTYARGDAAAPPAISARVPMGESGTWGSLVALAVDSPLEPQDQVALERAVELIALALMRRQEEEALTARRRGDFLAGLIDSHPGDEKIVAPSVERKIAAGAAELGFAPSGDVMMPLAIAAPARADDGEDSGWAAVRSDLVDELEQQAVPVLAGTGENGYVLLVLGLVRAADRERLADQVATLIARSAERRAVSGRPTICVGAAATGWIETAAELGAAAHAIPASANLDARPWHDVSVASPDRLLFAFRETPELREFVDQQLRPLIERDRQGRGDLLQTLAAYCANGGHKVQTARALHVERQTLYNRLRRIEEALEVDLDDGETRFSLHLAVRAKRHLDRADH
jgi:PucR family transcriptional regulator, purine catabolism regulatory protein